jgi:hypothetical protein
MLIPTMAINTHGWGAVRFKDFISRLPGGEIKI